MITLPAVTLALALTNPVQVSACSLNSITAATYESIGTLLNIRFVNNGTTPISAVAFAVTEDGKTSTIVDRGTFSPGVVIAHSFRADQMYGFDASCKVASVLFADGSANR